MKIVQINATCGSGSTGKICVDISKLLTERGVENYILYCGDGSNYPLGIQCGDMKQIKMQALHSHINGKYGFNSQSITRRMIRHLDELRPDVVHLHNLHGHNCNIATLFEYLKKNNIRVIWTFHDCWAFTAYCPYFTMAKCDKWETGCESCPQRAEYSFFYDRSKELYLKKKELMEGLNLTIVTPSQWLADLVKRSFLKEYPVKVINNGIDLAVFEPSTSNFCEKYGIPEEKYILLGVAFDWGIRKGLDVFIELAKRLDLNRYQIVLVGTNDAIDKQLPNNVLAIHRTQNQKELAQIYSAADLFVNPTREDNYPTVNMESLACGTPVLTFKTGGSPEIPDKKTGAVVDIDDISTLEREIIRICKERPFKTQDCIERAKQFDARINYAEYIKLCLYE